VEGGTAETGTATPTTNTEKRVIKERKITVNKFAGFKLSPTKTHPHPDGKQILW
jgi:hypothetical protein